MWMIFGVAFNFVGYPLRFFPAFSKFPAPVFVIVQCRHRRRATPVFLGNVTSSKNAFHQKNFWFNAATAPSNRLMRHPFSFLGISNAIDTGCTSKRHLGIGNLRYFSS
jgi:hypothetical protein